MNVAVHPRISLICIGNELLSGTRANTNATFIHRTLQAAGYPITHSCMVTDDPEAMHHNFQQQYQASDLVITTGGLGPTSDDITLPLLAEFFQTRLVEDPAQKQRVEQFFRKRGREMTASNRSQFLRLEQGEILINRSGTAPGHLYQQEDKLWISLPGVPFEMETLLREQVVPLLRERWPKTPAVSLSWRLAGIGESALYDLLLKSLRLEELGRVAFLPSLLGQILEVHNPAPGAGDTLRVVLEQYLVSTSGKTLPEVLVYNLEQQGLTVATAESCTGGLVGQLLTSVPGASAVYPGGMITYSNEQKSRLLGVSPRVLEEQGAVSQPVVEMMAAQVREQFRTDYGLAVSGIAGPEGGTPDKPVGTVWHALATEQGVRSSLRQFGSDRKPNRQLAAATVLTMLFRDLRDTNRWVPV